MKTTPNLGTPFPEALPDLADVPRNLRDIATSWENAFGGVGIDFVPYATQGVSAGSTYAVLSIDPASPCRVRKMGKTVLVQARLDVLAGTGLAGYPRIALPYPMRNPGQPCGIISSKVGASTFVTTMAMSPTIASETGVVEAFGNTTARIAADWFLLLLRYDTV